MSNAAFDDTTGSERLALASRLGLAPATFGSWLWVAPHKRWVLEQRIYWLTGEGLFHSGPFLTLDEALLFLVKRYGRAVD